MKHIKTQVDLAAKPSVVWAHLVDTESIGASISLMWRPADHLQFGYGLEDSTRVSISSSTPCARRPRASNRRR